LIVAWRRFARSRHGATARQEFDAVREQLLTVLFIALGFLAGAAAGALAFAATGLRGALVAVAIVAALAVWALWRER
jgi:VIT1/CCC1 family predicted Fe2+/Mn2+ transporter